MSPPNGRHILKFVSLVLVVGVVGLSFHLMHDRTLYKQNVSRRCTQVALQRGEYRGNDAGEIRSFYDLYYTDCMRQGGL